MSAHRLCLVHLPAAQGTAWRDAANAAAAAAGWRIVELGPDQTPPDDAHDTLIHVFEARLGEVCAPLQRLIIADDPDRAAEAFETVHALDRDAATRVVAVQYARAAEMAAAGWPVADGRLQSLDFPGLGTITREGPPPTVRGAEGPLAFYRTLPPTPGVSVNWPTDIVLSTEASGPGRRMTDLTGRRRLLRYGPYLELSPGRWTVDVDFALRIDRAKVELRFEWGTQHDVDVATHLLTTSGVYALTLSKVWTEPAVVELRVWLDRSVFDGDLEITGCRVSFSPLESEPPAALPEPEAAA
ncbi:hypothetical protein [Brevundimonas goettingensis]|jgi:hypothetical protein|uniref:Uncharacterized protein n=1 Tax=Brevundimonas goettingensis TaxID=2774190 RepID=A0A975GVZ8_9CAUL|nr:hypothetical protein [Brevundimonas goettingensis]QTC91179.1 hypothetical protein IFJ75_18605 [Brevundimonas goettingensis]